MEGEGCIMGLPGGGIGEELRGGELGWTSSRFFVYMYEIAKKDSIKKKTKMII